MFGLFKKKPKKSEPTREQILDKIKFYRELRTICINNARYLRSSINVYNSVVNTAKGNSAAETKRKREAAKSRLAWLKEKVVEEQDLVEYYTKVIKHLNLKIR